MDFCRPFYLQARRSSVLLRSLLLGALMYKDLEFGSQLKLVLEKEGRDNWLLINVLNLMYSTPPLNLVFFKS